MTIVALGMGNKEYNQNEERVSGEVHDLYRFLHQHETMAPNRKKDVLRASVNFTPFGYIFGGLVSTGAAMSIDNCSSGDPCAGLQRDHFFTWKETAEYFFSRELKGLAEFWSELKRRNEIVLLTKKEHSLVGVFQRQGYGPSAYGQAGIQLIRIDSKAIKLSGNKAGIVRKYWPPPDARVAASLSV
jgi:hypothetical protein